MIPALVELALVQPQCGGFLILTGMESQRENCYSQAHRHEMN